MLNKTQQLEKEMELINELEAEFAYKARNHFGPFVQYTMPGYMSNWYNVAIRKKLNDFAEGKIKKLMLFMPPQHGKLIYSSILIYTTDGWKKHGDLKVGDYVYHPSGKPVKVIATSEETRCDRRITFTNGEVIETHSNHEWYVIPRGNKPRVLETKIIETKKYWQHQTSGKYRAKYQLPHKKPLVQPESELKIDPYLLGLWLGDGETSSVTLTLNKHIPKEYETSSIAQRLQLLAGFIDADGYYYEKNGRYTLSNTNKDVIDSLARILSTLDVRTTVSEFEPGLRSGGIQGKKKVYQLTFNTSLDIPCRLERKKNTNPMKIKRMVGIKNIEKINDPNIKGKCIQVDSPDGLYLVGETLLPTHNSQLVSRSLPPYILGKDPTKRIVGVSYSGDFAKRFSKDAKRIIASPEYAELFPHTKINTARKRDQDESATANMYEIIKHRGYHQTVGVGGQLTGVTVDIGIIDDIIKDSIEANSETTRQNHWDWYETVFCTRLHNESQQLITFTRWHEDDLAGRLIAQEGDEWEIINLPALYEDNERAWAEDIRELDQALWPEKHSKERLDKIRENNPGTFSALYQQRPAPADGLIISTSDFQYYNPHDINVFTEMIQTWDCSFKGKVTSDWVVGQVWGRIGAKYYLVDQIRGKMGIMKTIEAVLKLTQKYPKAKIKVVEDKANGPAVIEILRNHITGLIAFTPEQDKEARAKGVAHCVESHNVFLPDPAKYPWVKVFVDEWRSFPNGAHDDMVDASTQAWFRFETKRKIPNVTFGSVTKIANFANRA